MIIANAVVRGHNAIRSCNCENNVLPRCAHMNVLYIV